jgi:hypothetical protein
VPLICESLNDQQSSLNSSLPVDSIIELDVEDLEHGSQTGDSAFQQYITIIQVNAVQLNLGFSTIYGNLCGKRKNWPKKFKN